MVEVMEFTPELPFEHWSFCDELRLCREIPLFDEVNNSFLIVN